MEFDAGEGSLTGKVEPRDHEPRRELCKSMGLETAEDVKIPILVYSVEEYRDKLGGACAGTDGGFVAALKAYGWSRRYFEARSAATYSGAWRLLDSYRTRGR